MAGGRARGRCAAGLGRAPSTSIVGWIGLVLLVGAWVDQVVLVVQGRAATATAVQAFGDFGRDALGSRAEIRPEKVVVERNVEFRRVAGKRLRLDVYRPASRRGRAAARRSSRSTGAPGSSATSASRASRCCATSRRTAGSGST